MKSFIFLIGLILLVSIDASAERPLMIKRGDCVFSGNLKKGPDKVGYHLTINEGTSSPMTFHFDPTTVEKIDRYLGKTVLVGLRVEQDVRSTDVNVKLVRIEKRRKPGKPLVFKSDEELNAWCIPLED